jgi:rubrerythrin
MKQTNENFIDVKELMQIAINFEEDSIQFYLRMQEQTEDVKVMDALKLLENQEIEHKRILQEYELGPGPYAVLQYGPSFSLSMPVVEEKNITLNELLEVAIEREVKSSQIYERSSQLVRGKISELLSQLAGFETEHVEKLTALRTYIRSEDWV